MEIPSISHSYTLKTYWLSFLVVAVVTILLLLLFGVASERYSGKVAYRSLTRTILDRSRDSMK